MLGASEGEGGDLHPEGNEPVRLTGQVRRAGLSAVDCQPALLENLSVVITSFPASPHLNAKITTGVLVFVSKYYEQDSETENLISC